MSADIKFLKEFFLCPRTQRNFW